MTELNKKICKLIPRVFRTKSPRFIILSFACCVGGFVTLIFFYKLWKTDGRIFTEEAKKAEKGEEVLDNASRGAGKSLVGPSSSVAPTALEDSVSADIAAPQTHNNLSEANAPRDPVTAANLSEWTGTVNLKDVELSFEKSCSSEEKAFSSKEILQTARAELGLETEFPTKGHLVRIDFAFGIPGPRVVLLRMQWNGARPPLYDVSVQESEEFKSLAASLGYEAAKSRLENLIGAYRKELG